MTIAASGHRALVVEDDKLVRWSMKEHLSRIGHDVDAAETGEQALEKLAAKPIDFMLLDVRLPGINGIEVLKRALALQPDIAVVLMSAHSTIDIAVDAMKLGATDFLVKPFSFSDLDDALSRAMSLKGTRDRIAVLSARDPDSDAALSSIIGGSAAMERIRELVARVAANDTATILVDGESGVGKEVVARAIHGESSRRRAQFCQLNCGALPEQLFESELFGHERGAFTDAHARKLGLVETAKGGTVLLDELAEMPMAGQVKLLQLLESKTFRRVGGTEELAADVRILAATNVDLQERVEERRFRADLYFRLNVVTIHVPPLREHVDDIGALAAHFIARANNRMGYSMTSVAPAAMEILTRYYWPGNVRELRNLIERALILNPEAEELRPEHLPPRVRTAAESRPTTPAAALATDGDLPELRDAEKGLIVEALERTNGNQSQASRILGVTRNALRYRMKKHGLL